MKALSTVKLYAGNVTKTRTKADNIAEKQINYLCVLRKNWGKSAVQLRAVFRPNVPAEPQTDTTGIKTEPDGPLVTIRIRTPKYCTELKKVPATKAGT